jgi:hypothetical protein
MKVSVVIATRKWKANLPMTMKMGDDLVGKGVSDDDEGREGQVGNQS